MRFTVVSAATVATLLSAGPVSFGQSITLNGGFPRVTPPPPPPGVPMPQGGAGKVFAQGSVSYANGFSATLTMLVMPVGGGPIKFYSVPLNPPIVGAGGVTTQSFTNYSTPDKERATNLYVWFIMNLTGPSALDIGSIIFNLNNVANGAPVAGQPLGTVATTRLVPPANALRATVTCNITSPWSQANNPNGTIPNGALGLFGLPTVGGTAWSNVTGGVVVQTTGPGNNPAPVAGVQAAQNAATLQINNVGSGTFCLLGTAPLAKLPAGPNETIGSDFTP